MDDSDDAHGSLQSALPSITELFGIKATDKLDSLAAGAHRPPRAIGPPPSAYSRQAVRASSPSSLDQARSPSRSNSFSSGQYGEVGRTRRPSPSPRGTRASTPYPAAMIPVNSRSSTLLTQSPTEASFAHALPPLSAAIPEFTPANRGRAVSDTEAHSRVGPSGRSSVHSSYHSFLDSAPLHPSLYPRLRSDSVDEQQQRRHVGRSPVHTVADDVQHPSPSARSHAHSIPPSSALSDVDTAQSHAWGGRRSMSGTSRSSMEYPPSSSSHEYTAHPYASSRQTGQYPALPHVATAPAVPGPYSSESSTHASPSRGHDRAPPSSFPHGVYPTTVSRPRSANSSEGDESKPGYGKYECEYCSKRFNRPSSLRIHINTHTGAKPFQCPFLNCGRRFSVMSNMRRHARTHGNMMVVQPDEDQTSQYQSGQSTGPRSMPPSRRSGDHDLHGDSGRGSGGPSSLGSTSSRRQSHPQGRSNHHPARWIGSNGPENAGMEVDELDDDEDDEMETDAGGGSSESDGYPPRKSLQRSQSMKASIQYGRFPHSPTAP
ncbi:SubName: Full=Uncharacterized protein {ECO:0000313/EMBL:CCA68950.1} [Serendipita indica DSM 11827]|nr:SubName: Full=Uncharacterized protein {ECO:0000313/EMBL:CCA68950.1} [Serendipita indica DSM 11827]